MITSTDVSIAVDHLKSGKGDVFGGLCSDHFINGTQRLYVFYLLYSLYFYVIIIFITFRYNDTPTQGFKKKSFCSSSNNRAIALSSILKKILDWIILLKEHKSMSSSPLQFGFKKGLSTTQCTQSLFEIEDYYNYNKSDVFVLMLDASKTFDRVMYCKLLTNFLTVIFQLNINIYVHESNI